MVVRALGPVYGGLSGVSLYLKGDVQFRGLTVQSLIAIQVVRDILAEMGATCVVTSGTDGRHSHSSSHYTGNAVDFRTRHLEPQDQERLATLARQRLNREYDVVLEHDPPHLHVEYDPKGRAR